MNKKKKCIIQRRVIKYAKHTTLKQTATRQYINQKIVVMDEQNVILWGIWVYGVGRLLHKLGAGVIGDGDGFLVNDFPNDLTMVMVVDEMIYLLMISY